MSEICLGTENFGDGTTSEQRRHAIEVFETFAEAGGTFVDTSHGYQRGASEALVGELIASDRDRFVVATKYGMTTQERPLRMTGSNRINLRRSVEESLDRLGVDAIDVLYLHIWDFTSDWTEVLSTMNSLVASGKVHYICVSNTPAWEVARAVTISELRGWEPFVATQIKYNLLDRSAERELLPMARALDLAVIAWAPLDRGALATGQAGKPVRGGLSHDARQRALETVVTTSREIGCAPAQVALAWLRGQGRRWGTIIPVVGADTAAQMRENIDSLQVELGLSHITALEEQTKVDLGYPYDHLLTPLYRNLTTGFHASELDHHRSKDPRVLEPE